jgi:hypothetical protein
MHLTASTMTFIGHCICMKNESALLGSRYVPLQRSECSFGLFAQWLALQCIAHLNDLRNPAQLWYAYILRMLLLDHLLARLWT